MIKITRLWALAVLPAVFGAISSSSSASDDERFNINRFRVEGNTLVGVPAMTNQSDPDSPLYPSPLIFYDNPVRHVDAFPGVSREKWNNPIKVAVAQEDGQKPTAIAENPGAPIPLAAMQLTNEAMGSLLREADVLIRSGKLAEAYKLLEPLEGDYSGEVAFDYMLGITALDSGKPDRATIAFELVLMINPNFSGARLDLARAYFAMGSDDLARNEFEIVLTQSPPENVKGVVQKYLDAIEARRLAKIQHVSGYLEASIAADSNVTAVTSDFTTGVQNTFGIPGVLPTGSSVLSSGMTAGVAAGVDFNRVLSEEYGISVFAGADIKQRYYKDLSSLNSSNLDLRGGLGIASGDDSFRLFVNLGQYRQEGMSEGVNANRNTPGIGVEWKRKLGDRDQFTLFTQYSKPRYPTQDTQDTNQLMLNASWLHIFEGNANPLIFASVNQSVDHAVRPLATGSDMSRTTTAVRAHFQLTPLANLDAFLSAGISRRNDDSLNARSALTPAVYGRDLTKDVSFGVNWRPMPKWTLKGQFAYYRNDSNLELYQYRRRESTISLRYDF